MKCLTKNRSQMMRILRLSLLTSFTAFALVVISNAQLIWLGVLGDCYVSSESRAYGVSVDGVVVGESTTSECEVHAFLWKHHEMQDLGTLGGLHSVAYGISADRPPIGVTHTVVGMSYNQWGFRHAFRWKNGVMYDLGIINVEESWAFDVSSNGGVIVGWGLKIDADELNWIGSCAMRWKPPFLMEFCALGWKGSEAFGVSADGNVMVGWFQILPSGDWHAFRWIHNSGTMQDLGTLGGSNSQACGTSADGSVVVGWSNYDSTNGMRAFRWTPQEGMVDLGALDGMDSIAWGVSGDGSIVVGSSSNYPSSISAFRWSDPHTGGNGMEDLNITYAHLLQDGSRLIVATAISLDGRYIVGWGYNAQTDRTEAFLLVADSSGCTPHNGDVDSNGCVDDADLLAVIQALGLTGPNLGRVDVNCDGVVDDADLLIVISNLGAGC